MNRRGFLDSILKAGVAAMILPPALTYARKWKLSPSNVWTITMLPTVNHYQEGILKRGEIFPMTREEFFANRWPEQHPYVHPIT